MRPYKSTVLHGTETLGDCFRAVLGSLMDRDPNWIPHFFAEHDDPDEAMEAVDVWLATHGLARVSLYHDGNETAQRVRDYMDANNPHIYYGLAGVSQRGVGHIVVCLGDAIVNDPSTPEHMQPPDLAGPLSHGYWMILLLVPGFLYAV